MLTDTQRLQCARGCVGRAHGTSAAPAPLLLELSVRSIPAVPVLALACSYWQPKPIAIRSIMYSDLHSHEIRINL